MNTTLSKPAIEAIKVTPVSVTINADMKLASIPVTVSGRYTIDNNVFYPEYVTLRQDIENERGVMMRNGTTVSIETMCRDFAWDEIDTANDIQEAVEKRDQ